MGAHVPHVPGSELSAAELLRARVKLLMLKSPDSKGMTSALRWNLDLKVIPNAAICKSGLTTNREDGITLIQGDISHHTPVIRLSFRIQLSRAIGNSP